MPARRLGLVRSYAGNRILLLRPSEEMHRSLPALEFQVPELNGFQVPPFKFEKIERKLEERDCWIGCIARSDQGGKNTLEALLGAISLLLPHPGSRIFSMAERIPYTYCIGGQWMARMGPPTFPSLGRDYRLEEESVEIITNLLESQRAEEEQQRIELGLQFVGSSWEPASRLSFMQNAIAMDALFGKRYKVRDSIKEMVSKLAPDIRDIDKRTDLLINIRNALLHGKVGSVEAAAEYISYFEIFGCDPQSDQIEIIARCIRKLASTN